MKQTKKILWFTILTAFCIFASLFTACTDPVGPDIELQQVQAPVADPDSGEVETGTPVELASPTDGALIRYTTDGVTEPTGTTGTAYTGPITINENITIKAIAVKEGMIDSDVVTFVYTVRAANQVARPTVNPGAGEVDINTPVALATTTADAIIHFTIDGTNPTTASDVFDDGDPIIINQAMTIKAFAVKDGYTDSTMLEAAYTVRSPNQVAMPSASPEGGEVAAGTSVTLSTTTADAIIHYTTDGIDPTTASDVFHDGDSIIINQAMTIKAIAVKTGYTDSNIMTAVYTVEASQPSFIDTLAYDGITTAQWYDDWGTKGYLIEGEHAIPAPDIVIRDLPAGSYLRVVFQGLDDEWPGVPLLTLSNIRGNGGKININLIETGEISNGRGEAFIAVNQIKTFSDENPAVGWSNWNNLGYDHGDPSATRMMARPGSAWQYQYLEIEIWVPASTTVNHTAFQDLIILSEELLESVEAHDGINSAAELFVTQSVWNAFNAAITTSKNATIATQVQINAAAIALLNARKIFAAEIQSVDKTALLETIVSANALLNSVNIGDPGSAAGLYATQDNYDIFEQAIADAQAVADNATATSTAVSNALTALGLARTAFAATLLEAGFSKNNYQHDSQLDLTIPEWATWEGTTGFFIRHTTIFDDIVALDSNAYFRVEFEHIGDDWPQTVSFNNGTYTFTENYLRISRYTGPAANIMLEGLGPVTGGRGEAFIPVSVIKDFLINNGHDGWLFYALHYGPSLNVPNSTITHPQPYFAEGAHPSLVFDDDILKLEVWVPID